jgi:Xaa-Pro aminopeptidase
VTPFERRTRELQDRLEATEGAVFFPSPNLYYLTGFWEEPSERPLFAIVGPSGDPQLIVPQLAADQIDRSTWIEAIHAYDDSTDPLPLVRERVADLGLLSGTLYVDPTMWATFTHDLRATLPQVSFVLAADLMDSLRIRKDTAELASMRSAATIADQVSSSLREMGEDVVGMTETELARTIETRLAERGGTDLAFPVIVGSGPNGALPHHTHGDRQIESGDPVVLDFGTRVDHYPSDQTRTIVFGGDPPAAFRDVYDAVRTAHDTAVETVEPGIPAGAVDDAARRVIEDRGWGDEFIHRTGHGVGLSVHEEPYIVADSDRRLEPGMVFSVEPGIYLDGAFGVRIEDLVVVTDEGCERLNASSRDWRP